MWAVLTSLCACVGHVHSKHLLLVGETGAGKSTLGNTILRREAFQVGHDLKSCTTRSQTESGKLFGSDVTVEVTDTGGLGDSEGRDETFVRDVADHVRSRAGFDGILYVHNACVPRITKGAQNSMLEMLHTLADDASRAQLWRHFGIVLTQCAQNHLVYTSQLPRELRSRFQELDFDVPIFWYVGEKSTTDKVVGSIYSFLGMGDFENQITSWMQSLPPRFTMPTESKREELKRKFEENQKKELEQKRRSQDLQDRIQQLETEKSYQHQTQRIRDLEERIQQLESQDSYGHGGGTYSPSSGCFAKDSVVNVQGKGTLPLYQVKVGDKLATVGSNPYVEVVAWMHHDLHVIGDAVEIFSSVGALRLTSDHLVFVEAGNERVAVPALEIRVGDRIIGTNGTGSVSAVATTQMHGYMLPLTTSGDLLVDGMLASCYGQVGTLSHSTINGIMASLRSSAFPPWLRPQTNEAWSRYAIFFKKLIWLLRL